MKSTHLPKSRLVPYSPLKELIPYIRPYFYSFFKTFLALCCTAFSILAIGPSLRILIDNGLQSENFNFLNQAIVLLIILSIILAFSAYIRLSSTALLAEHIISDLRKDLFAHLLTLDTYFFDKARLGDLLVRIGEDCSLLKTLLSTSGAIFLRGTIQFLGAIILMGFTSLKLTFSALLIIPLASLPLWFLGARLKQKTSEGQDAQGNLMAFVKERLENVVTLKVFTQEKHTQEGFTILNTKASHINRESILLRARLISLIIGGTLIAISVIVSLGSYSVLTKNLSAGNFLSFLFYALVAAGSLNEIAEVLGDFQKASGAMSRLLDVFKNTTHIEKSSVPLIPTQQISGNLSFKNITFSYPTRPQVQALENFSLSIKKGEKIAIVGPSGAGKSTLFRLLLRLYEPQEGSLWIDDHDMSKLDLSTPRQAFSLVSQETAIFHETLYQNIAFARPDAPYQEVIQAAEAAYIHEFAHSLPQGFDTLVGDQGKQLSGGQRQRVAIARALLKNAPILLLDEATNALDPQSESFIQKAISHLVKDRTTLTIAHRLTTIKECDHIYVMDKGKLVEHGTHETLMRSDGLYKKLYTDSIKPFKEETTSSQES